jgi:hypothetical protein
MWNVFKQIGTMESSAFKNSPFKVLGECVGLTVQEIQKILPKEGS